MSYLRVGLVILNALAFVTLLVLSVRFGRREKSPRVRRLWLVVGLASAALVLGSTQRLILQATTIGWIPESTGSRVLQEWQILQSVTVAVIAVAAFITLKNLATSMAASERIARSILDRAGHVDPARLNLTNREKDVLAVIGEGLITDAELSDALHISSSTVQTHVKSLLRKTQLRRRQDLLAVAYLVDTADDSGRASRS
jgi:DNA-binding CsgD family transcriptional regulator